MPANVDERLAAADPVGAAGRLTPDEQREADALLERIVATPPEAQERAPRSAARLRRVALAAAGVAVAGMAAVVALDLLDSGEPSGTGVVDRAVAAVSEPASVYHVLQRRRGTGSVPGATIPPHLVETWHSSEGARHEKVFAIRDGRRGRLLEEVAGRRLPGRQGGPLLRYDPRRDTFYAGGFRRGPGQEEVPALDPGADPGTTLTELHERGKLRLEGERTVGDEPAYRLVSGPVPGFRGDVVRVEFLVDRDTYLPLLQRVSIEQPSGETLGYVTRYLVYERLPLDDSGRATLAMDPHPGAKCGLGADELSLGFANPCARP